MRRRPIAVGRRGPGLLGTVARTAAIAGTATVTANAISGHRRRQEAEAAAADQAAYEQQQQVAQLQQQVAQPPAPPTAAAGLDLTGELGKLAALRDGGALSEEEFAAAKAKLLG